MAEEETEEDVDFGGDEADGVGVAGEGRGDAQQDFADEFEREVGPDVWGSGGVILDFGQLEEARER